MYERVFRWKGVGLSAIVAFAIAAAAAVVGCDEAALSRSSASSGKSETGVVAKVGDREITLDEVDTRARESNMKAFQELYEARKDALDELVADALLEQEARNQGMSRQELEAKEIEAKVAPVDQQTVQAFYDQNRPRLRGQSLEDLAPQIQAYLTSRNQAVARQSYIAELRAKAKVELSLDPPRTPIQVAENERTKGPANAPVTIVEYSDFQ